MFFFLYILAVLAFAPVMGRDLAAAQSLVVLFIWIFSNRLNRERAYGFIRGMRLRYQGDQYQPDLSGQPYRSGVSVLRPLAWICGAITAVGVVTPLLPWYVSVPAFVVMLMCLLLIKTAPDSMPHEYND